MDMAVESSHSPFDSLPDEIVLKIIDLASATKWRYDKPHKQDFLLDVIAKTSLRFKSLAEDKSLWKGEVRIEGDRAKIEQVIRKYLNEEVTHLWMGMTGYQKEDGDVVPSTVPIFTATDVRAVAEKCPNLEEFSLNMVNLVGWPSLGTPWWSMKKLWINGVERNCFDNVALHETVPNIEELDVCGHLERVGSLLPDMNQCEALKELTLSWGMFQMPYGMIPFPPRLNVLWGTEKLVHPGFGIDLHQELQRHCPYCDLECTRCGKPTCSICYV